MTCTHTYKYGFSENGWIDFKNCEPYEGIIRHLFCEKCGDEIIRASL